MENGNFETSKQWIRMNMKNINRLLVYDFSATFDTITYDVKRFAIRLYYECCNAFYNK